MITGLSSFGLPVTGAETGYFAARATLALVLGACIGASLFEGLAIFIEGEHGADPTRIAAYIVSDDEVPAITAAPGGGE